MPLQLDMLPKSTSSESEELRVLHSVHKENIMVAYDELIWDVLHNNLDESLQISLSRESRKLNIQRSTETEKSLTSNTLFYDQ